MFDGWSLLFVNSRLPLIVSDVCRDRIELPMAEDAFGNSTEAREIIEEYNEDEELKWREQHKIRVREQKQREAAERREQEREQMEADDDKNILEILEQAELMEELENELEELNVENDNHLQQHLQSNSMNGNASHSDQVHSDDDADFYDDDDDVVPDEFRDISRAAANMSIEEKLKFYENHLSEIRNYLSTRKFTKFEDLKELADKRGVQECLRNAIDEIVEEKAKSDPEESSAKSNGNLEMDEPDSVCTLSPPDGRKCLTVAEFKQLEHSYLNRSKSVALVFYKSQMRSVMKSIASCSKDAHGDHANEKRELYEYINDSIDRLRAEIELEKQAKLEEKFVDDDTDNEAPADDDDEDGLDIGYDVDDTVPDSINASASNANDDTVGVASADSTMISPTKRKICFASKPSVTTYHLDDEPWRVQNSSGETDETINSLMDETFQFFNSPSSSSSSSECDYDGHDDDVNATATFAATNSTNKCDDDGMETNLCTMNSSCDADDDINRLESISQEMLSASKTLYYKDGSTLYLKFAHTATAPPQPLPIGSPTVNVASLHTITSPIDIYNQFGSDAATAAKATIDESEIEKQKLKDYVLKVANLNADELQQKMANYLAGKSASSSLPNGNHASQMAKSPMAEPKKSILKNCDAVKREIHGKIFDQIGDDGKHSSTLRCRFGHLLMLVILLIHRSTSKFLYSG